MVTLKQLDYTHFIHFHWTKYYWPPTGWIKIISQIQTDGLTLWTDQAVFPIPILGSFYVFLSALEGKNESLATLFEECNVKLWATLKARYCFMLPTQVSVSIRWWSLIMPHFFKVHQLHDYSSSTSCHLRGLYDFCMAQRPVHL